MAVLNLWLRCPHCDQILHRPPGMMTACGKCGTHFHPIDGNPIFWGWWPWIASAGAATFVIALIFAIWP